MRKITSSIALVTCSSCVGRVDGFLAAVPGVVEASASPASETASVTYLEGLTAPQAIASASGEAGYFRGAPDMNSFAALGTAAAWPFSVVATFAPVCCLRARGPSL